MEFFHQRSIHIPEAWRTQARQEGARGSETPPAIITGIGIRPEILIAAKDRLERGRVNPVGLLLYSGTALAQRRVPYQVGPAGHAVTWSGYVEGHTTLSGEIRCQPPSAEHTVCDPASIQEPPTLSNREVVAPRNVEHVCNVVDGNRAVPVLIVVVLVHASQRLISPSCSYAAAEQAGARVVNRVEQHGG